MKKIIPIIAVVVLVGGAATFVIMNKKSNESTSSNASQSDPVTFDTDNVSINDLLTRNASLSCTYEVQDGNSQNTGMAYFSGANDMYGEFTNKTKEKTSTAYVIRNNDTQYVWQKGSKNGYKADVSAYDKQKQEQMNQQLDPDKKYEFKCQNWDKDESKFEVPSDITFQDISAQLNQAQGASQNTKEQACNAISNPDAKAACKNAL